MKFRITTLLNDGMAEAPGFEIETSDSVSLIEPELGRRVLDELSENDFAPGVTVTVERIS